MGYCFNLAGFEALVRWRHPALGLLAPESFIGLAEQTGMIKDIGKTVLNEAGRQLGIWQRAYRTAEPAFVAVNISSAQLIEPGLLDDVKQIISREGLMRGSFKIEVTESLVMEYPERATQILERFRELGVGVDGGQLLVADDVGPALRTATAKVTKVARSGGGDFGGGGGGGFGGGQQGAAKQQQERAEFHGSSRMGRSGS